MTRSRNQTGPPSRHLSEQIQSIDPLAEGNKGYALIKALYPICRSITGNGVRQSLRLLQDTVPLVLHEVPSGTEVFDWTVPKEWNIRDAYIKNEVGERVIDFQRSNLHVLNYSIPVRRKMALTELRSHLFTSPETPDWIPYRTSYYREAWGFCMTQRQLERMQEGEYEVCIDSTLEPGHLSYGEYRIQGATDDEVLISCHSCHPSLCNDNLSGMVMAARLARLLEAVSLRHSYRFLWAPGTIGSITWLALNEPVLSRIKHGVESSMASFCHVLEIRDSFTTSGVVREMRRSTARSNTFSDIAATTSRCWNSLHMGTTSDSIVRPALICRSAPSCELRTDVTLNITLQPMILLSSPSSLGESLLQLLRVIQIFE